MSHRRFAFQKFALLASSALLLSSGCFGSRSADQALTNALAQAGQQKEPIYPLAGNVTIDGLPPHFEKHEALIVMLNEPEKLDTPPTTRRYVETTPSGEFCFSTYEPRDGTKPGKYILTFAILREKGKFGLIGPDKLNNLYNDPDKNSSIPELTIDHQAPGKSGYSFNLEVAGKEPASPGPHAITRIVQESLPGADRIKMTAPWSGRPSPARLTKRPETKGGGKRNILGRHSNRRPPIPSPLPLFPPVKNPFVPVFLVAWCLCGKNLPLFVSGTNNLRRPKRCARLR